MVNSFPTHRVNEFDIVNLFTEYDEDKDVNIRYMIFESSNVDNDDTELIEELNYYVDMLFDHTYKLVDTYIKKLITNNDN
jgi:hypothetical protein